MSKIGEASCVVGKKSGRVVLALSDGFAEEHERPGESEANKSFPFLPYLLVGFPRALGHGAIQQGVLGRFFDSRGHRLCIGEGDP